jgi:hypothetical protein
VGHHPTSDVRVLAISLFLPQSAAPRLAASNFPLRSQCELIDQQLLRALRPSHRVRGVSPYKPHYGRVHREGLRPPAFDIFVRGHSRHIKELGYPRDSAASLYGHHRIAVVDFNFVWIHLLHAVCAAVILQRFRLTRAAGSDDQARGFSRQLSIRFNPSAVKLNPLSLIRFS